jgi:hypothetical protein
VSSAPFYWRVGHLGHPAIGVARLGQQPRSGDRKASEIAIDMSLAAALSCSEAVDIRRARLDLGELELGLLHFAGLLLRVMYSAREGRAAVRAYEDMSFGPAAFWKNGWQHPLQSHPRTAVRTLREVRFSRRRHGIPSLDGAASEANSFTFCLRNHPPFYRESMRLGPARTRTTTTNSGPSIVILSYTHVDSVF